MNSQVPKKTEISLRKFSRDENVPVAGVGGILDLVLAVPHARGPPRPSGHLVAQLRLGRLRRLRLPAVGAGTRFNR